MDNAANNLDLVRRIVSELVNDGFAPLLFGGWAEELLGMSAPRSHADVDLVLLDPPIDALDHWVAGKDEVVDKRLSQKRAFVSDGVLVELFIARLAGQCYETVFWDRLRWSWSHSMEPALVDSLPVASAMALRRFRESYDDFLAARP